MKPLLEKTIDSRIRKYILGNKFLREEKYFKANQWSMATWDSWAAQGKCGGCMFCRSKGYIATLRNKRATTDKGGKPKFAKEVSGHFCSGCLAKTIKILGVDFERF